MLLLLILPIFQSWYGRFFAILRAKTATLRDKRIKLMNEVICGMRAIKMYAWEHRFAERIHQLRRLECKKLLSTTRLNALNASFYMTTIPLVSLAMFVSYALSGNTLTTEKVFTVVAFVSSVSTIFSKIVPRGITLLKESGVSLKRIKDFLLLDEESSLSSEPCDDVNAYVVVDHLHASWKKESTEEVCSNITFTTTVGELLMIIGPVGCGKSSLLLAMLREIPLVNGDVQMAGRVAYVSQQPWVFSGSIKENITFGKDFDQEKYDEVVKVCALKKDIDSFVKGDETLVGDRGINLSGGQKSRINLARAVYLDADIYLIDDPLSAVDPHVARHIFDECIRGTLRPKVCVLVSHQLQFLEAADRILCMEKGQAVGYDSFQNLNKAGIDFASSLTEVEKSIQVNGSSMNDKSSEKLQLSTISNADKKTRKVMNTLSCNDISESLLPAECAKDQVKSTPDLRHEVTCAPTHTVQFDSTNDQSDEEEEKYLPSSHDNIHVERRITGRVASKSYKDYFSAGAQPAILVLCLILFLIGQASSIISDWWLAKWSNWEETVSRRNNSLSIIDDSRTENILIYSATVLICFVFSFLRAVVWFQILINASQHLHDRMFRGVIRAPIYFYDTNPVGRVLNRFSKDIGVIDDTLPMVFFDAFQLGVLGISILLISVVSQPYVIVAVAPVIGAFIWLRQYFVKSSREIKRLEAISRSPFYSHFTASLQGLPIIRASCEQNQYIELFDSYQDRNTAANYYYLSAIRWLGYRLDILCSSLIAVVAFAPFIAYEAGIGIDPVLVGLSLLYTKRLIGMFQFCVRQTAEVESQMVSVERALEYTQITPEARLSVMKEKSSTTWPPFGEIIGENVFFRYHESFSPVIKNLTFRIKAKEKIGIVGRTGAGKSSLISALFRLAEPDGVLMIDGVTITDIGLHDLREKISVIPQDPVLFSGSIRNNLDPFNKNEDVKIWDALEQVQLKHVVDNFPEKIHYDLSECGNNLSVGQRQLLCLARAILKKNKILVVDEATANVDEKTDTLIQKTIRVRFKDCTVLTVAHRLNTIMDADKVMVMLANAIN
ncbi:ATP-binding cassette subfamily C member 4-like isoform X2 [Xenia sp. Carnegie-2017]|uniref:ATP-binding cassette subfamily C member 4-like isoform X2 n=1 Tax=Xenia sp. Carnegie-2017 TaxID=2897299 RepID=UPI001F03E5D0|nr:ATP-binding cassette subfamily C member 4-like isoform X2 [Xenia sp. Carnegie-2017]